MASAVAIDSKDAPFPCGSLQLSIPHVEIGNLQKPSESISTGVGFFDHMLDQFNSHAQIGVSLLVNIVETTKDINNNNNNNNDDDNNNNYDNNTNNNNNNCNNNNNNNNGGHETTNGSNDAYQHHNRLVLHPQMKKAASNCNNNNSNSQGPLFAKIGQLLGTEFHRILEQNNVASNATSFFGCPLDEALVLVHLSRQPPPSYDTTTTNDSSSSTTTSLSFYDWLPLYNLAPYGSYPTNVGRRHLGTMELEPLKDQFWAKVARYSQVQIRMYKVWGTNAHHIVEASFKAFARALRNMIDGVDTIPRANNDNDKDDTFDKSLELLYGASSINGQASVALQRHGQVSRQTNETQIHAELWLDGGSQGVQVSTGLTILDAFWTTASREAHVSLHVACQGDLWIDEHHTAEDVAIALGQVWNQALGDKAGLNRMWCATVAVQTARVTVVLDLSNRPMLTHNLPLQNHAKEHLQNSVPVEMLDHVLDSFVVSARITLQIYVQPTSSTATSTEEEKKKNPKIVNGGKSILFDAANSNNSNSETSTATVQLEDAWSALAVALGQALRYCILVDSRRAGATASSKGTLSV